jgi:hypothetical protein
MIAFAAVFTYWTANYNNRAPTPIDGAWEVVSTETLGSSPPLPDAIFFEHNRARLCVHRTAGSYEWHHFEVDPHSQTLRIRRKWLSKGELLFSGTYRMSGDALILKAQSGSAPDWQEIHLRKRTTPRGADLSHEFTK